MGSCNRIVTFQIQPNFHWTMIVGEEYRLWLFSDSTNWASKTKYNYKRMIASGIFLMLFWDHPCMKAWMNRMHFLSCMMFPLYFFPTYGVWLKFGQIRQILLKTNHWSFLEQSSPPEMNWRTKIMFNLYLHFHFVCRFVSEESRFSLRISNDLPRPPGALDVSAQLLTVCCSRMLCGSDEDLWLCLGKLQRPNRRVVTPDGGLVRANHPKMPLIHI